MHIMYTIYVSYATYPHIQTPTPTSKGAPFHPRKVTYGVNIYIYIYILCCIPQLFYILSLSHPPHVPAGKEETFEV